MDYAETLPLADHEVVLTFDDGPIPPYTDKILDILAAECVKATYFIVGEMAREYPALVRRVYDEGHTVGTHSMNHPIRFRALSVERGNAQIDDGIAATAAALGDPDKVAPFFRFPGFGHTAAGPRARRRARPDGLGRRCAGRRLAQARPARGGAPRGAAARIQGQGHPAAARHPSADGGCAAASSSTELKARGFRIVHVVPASAERPATVTTAEAWLPHSRPKPAAPLIQVARCRNCDAKIADEKERRGIVFAGAAARRRAGRWPAISIARLSASRMLNLAPAKSHDQSEAGQGRPTPGSAGGNAGRPRGASSQPRQARCQLCPGFGSGRRPG